MSDETTIEVSVVSSIAQVDADEWDGCAAPEEAAGGRPLDPFTTHRFLLALERSGSVGEGTGWIPRHLVAKSHGQVIGVMPLYSKGHSQGEYIFDHNWAHAYEHAGGRYYPKLQSAVPFTPTTGRRFLTRPGRETVALPALVQAAVQLADENQLSSLHITFCTESEWKLGARVGLLQRTGQQFHWFNKSYDGFDGFLADLSSRKRKTIRKERRTAQGFGGTIHQFRGDDIQPEHWDAFWRFYQDTGARKWGTPYLTRAFFEEAHATLREDILLVMCAHEGRWVAGAMNMIGDETLYGRYWGCVEDHPCLHFEVCYYQAIDYAIANDMVRVEAGAQGEHKLARGYLPTPTYSLHWIADGGFRSAVEKYLISERDAVDHEIEVLTDYGPFRKVTGED